MKSEEMNNFYYFDTSAFVKRYIQEAGSQAVRDLLKKGGQYFISKIAYAEVLMTFRRKKEEGMLSSGDFLKCIESFEKDWQAFNIIELSDEVLKTLRERVLKYHLRALDAVHLSSVLWLKKSISIIFACSDNTLKEKASAEGLSIWDPTSP